MSDKPSVGGVDLEHSELMAKEAQEEKRKLKAAEPKSASGVSMRAFEALKANPGIHMTVKELQVAINRAVPDYHYQRKQVGQAIHYIWSRDGKALGIERPRPGVYVYAAGVSSRAAIEITPQVEMVVTEADRFVESVDSEQSNIEPIGPAIFETIGRTSDGFLLLRDESDLLWVAKPMLAHEA